MKVKKANFKPLIPMTIKMDDKLNNKEISINKKDEKLKNFIERIEKLEEEKYNLTTDIKEVFSEAKSMGYEPKIMRKILILRKMDIDDRLEQEALLDTYRNALGIY